jgi:hypothetical protein
VAKSSAPWSTRKGGARSGMGCSAGGALLMRTISSTRASCSAVFVKAKSELTKTPRPGIGQ